MRKIRYHLFLMCAALISTGLIQAQETEVVESAFALEWTHDEAKAPVGQWAVEGWFLVG